MLLINLFILNYDLIMTQTTINHTNVQRTGLMTRSADRPTPIEGFLKKKLTCCYPREEANADQF